MRTASPVKHQWASFGSLKSSDKVGVFHMSFNIKQGSGTWTDEIKKGIFPINRLGLHVWVANGKITQISWEGSFRSGGPWEVSCPWCRRDNRSGGTGPGRSAHIDRWRRGTQETGKDTPSLRRTGQCEWWSAQTEPATNRRVELEPVKCSNIKSLDFDKGQWGWVEKPVTYQLDGGHILFHHTYFW